MAKVLPRSASEPIHVRALRTRQAGDVDVYSFFFPGTRLLEIADISRIGRDANYSLKGFQRREIRSHVKHIVEFLDQGQVLFPNAIILALSSEVEFRQARGPRPHGLTNIATMGTLSIPVREEGKRVAWIVDGQQRSLALSRSTNKGLPVPVVAFVSDDLELQRTQFILVNKAKPLPTRLINELLPETSMLLPRDLAVRKIPSEMCNLLNKDPNSPFHGLVRRASDEAGRKAVVADSALITMVKNSVNNPLGALSPYKGNRSEPANLEAMYATLMQYWSAVRDTFQEAWGLAPSRSRLMHSAGIVSMGTLMDRVMARASGAPDADQYVRKVLFRIAPHCRWTSGTWDGLGLRWNEIQSVPGHIKALADALVRIEFETSRQSP